MLEKKLTAIHAQEKQTKKQQKRNSKCKWWGWWEGKKRGRRGRAEGQLQSTVGNNKGTVSQHFYTFWEAYVWLWGDGGIIYSIVIDCPVLVCSPCWGQRYLCRANVATEFGQVGLWKVCCSYKQTWWEANYSLTLYLAYKVCQHLKTLQDWGHSMETSKNFKDRTVCRFQ